jgi:hypothetical protein
MERQEIDQMVTWLTVIRDLGLLTYKGFQWRFTEKKYALGHHVLELISDNQKAILSGYDFEQLAKSLISWTAASQKPTVDRDEEISKILDLICSTKLNYSFNYDDKNWELSCSNLNSEFCLRYYKPQHLPDPIFAAKTLQDLAIKLYEYTHES